MAERDGNVVHRGNHHNRHIGITFLGLFEQPNSVHAGHHQVRKHQLELFAGIQ
jgi:hypothetical protein